MSIMANFQPNIFGEEAPGVYWLPRGTIGSNITFPFFLAGPTCSPSDVTISAQPVVPTGPEGLMKRDLQHRPCCPHSCSQLHHSYTAPRYRMSPWQSGLCFSSRPASCAWAGGEGSQSTSLATSSHRCSRSHHSPLGTASGCLAAERQYRRQSPWAATLCDPTNTTHTRQ